MTETPIENSFQLEFIAHYSMHLENIWLEMSSSKDTKQRDRYTQLIALIKEAPFSMAYEKYKQIASADTDIHLFSAAMLRQANRRAYMDLELPLPHDWLSDGELNDN